MTLSKLSPRRRNAHRTRACCRLRHPLLLHRETLRTEELRIHQVLLRQRAAQHCRRQEHEHQHNFHAELEQILVVRDLGLWGAVYACKTHRPVYKISTRQSCMNKQKCVVSDAVSPLFPLWFEKSLSATYGQQRACITRNPRLMTLATATRELLRPYTSLLRWGWDSEDQVCYHGKVRHRACRRACRIAEWPAPVI